MEKTCRAIFIIKMWNSKISAVVTSSKPWDNVNIVISFVYWKILF